MGSKGKMRRTDRARERARREIRAWASAAGVATGINVRDMLVSDEEMQAEIEASQGTRLSLEEIREGRAWLVGHGFIDAEEDADGIHYDLLPDGVMPAGDAVP